MEAFGYETPVAITPTEIFNPTMANMVLLSMGLYANALREDYNNTMKDYKDFMKEYGSFMSPIDKDVESYYNLTTGGLGDMFTYARQNGIDLLRSPEGRSLVLLYIASRPYRDMAMLRESAETAKQYRTLLADGIANGTLDYATAKKLDGDIKLWDSLQNGMWDKPAPTAQRTLNLVLDPYILDLLKSGYEVDPNLSKNGKLVKTVADWKILAQLNKNAYDIMKDPMMKLRAKELGMTDDLYIATELLRHMKSLLPKIEDIDKIYFENAKLAETRRHNRATENAQSNKTQTGLPQLTTIIDMATLNNKSNIDSGAFYNYFTTLAKNTKDANLKKKYQGYAKEWENFGLTNDEEKKRAFLKKYGYIDQNGLTSKFYQWQNKVTGAFRSNTKQDHDTTVKNSDYYYGSYMSSIVDGPAKNTLVRAVGGTKQKNGLYSVQFGSGISYSGHRALAFSGGYGTNKRAMIEKEFDRWLRNSKVTGNLWDSSNMVAGKLPGNVLEIAGVTTTIKADKLKEFLDYIKTRHVSTGKGYTDNGRITNEEILSCLGLSVMEADGKPTKWSTNEKGKTRESGEYATLYVGIPTSKSIDANGLNLYGLNSDFNKELFGGGSAYKLGEDASLESMIFNQ